MTDTNFKEMSNVGIDALASHYHRYAKWTVKTSVSNVHGDIRTFYSGMLTKDNVDKVEQTYINTYYQHKKILSTFSFFFFFNARTPPKPPCALIFFQKIQMLPARETLRGRSQSQAP